MKKYYLTQPLFRLSSLLLLALAMLVMHSCRKAEMFKDVTEGITDPEVLQAMNWYDSTYPTTGTSYSSDGKLSTASASNSDLSQFVKPDWHHTAKYARFNKKVIELPIDPEHPIKSGLKNNTTKQISNNQYSKSSFIILNNDKGSAAYIMTIIADSAYIKNDLSKLARNTYSKRDSDFSGTVVYTTPRGKFIHSYTYKNGHIVAPGQAVAQQVQGSSKLKVNVVALLDCIDWYWTVRVDGVVISETYLYTTCDDGSSSGGGSGPPPPCETNAVNNPGVRINVVAPPDDGGDDGDGFPDPTPVALTPCLEEPDTNNNVKNPCLKSMVSEVLSKNIQYDINNTLNSIFGDNSNVNLNILDANLPAENGIDLDAKTTHGLRSGSIQQGNLSLNVTITLNDLVLTNASKEYITASIIHEAIHAFLDYTTTLLNQHLDMVSNYMTSMQSTLKSIYPTLDDNTVLALTWGGLEGDAGSLWTDKSNLEQDLINLTNINYKNGNLGTKCP